MLGGPPAPCVIVNWNSRRYCLENEFLETIMKGGDNVDILRDVSQEECKDRCAKLYNCRAFVLLNPTFFQLFSQCHLRSTRWPGTEQHICGSTWFSFKEFTEFTEYEKECQPRKLITFK